MEDGSEEEELISFCQQRETDEKNNGAVLASLLFASTHARVSPAGTSSAAEACGHAYHLNVAVELHCSGLTERAR